MANKEAGLLAIFQSDGSVISADYLLRCKRHLESFTQRCINDGTLGSIFKISPDENLAQNITKTKNIFTDRITFNSDGETDFRFIRFGVDFDCFAKESSAYFDPSEIRVQINFTHTMKEIDLPTPEEPIVIDNTSYVSSTIGGSAVNINLSELEASYTRPSNSDAYIRISSIDEDPDETTNPSKSYNIEESLIDLSSKVYAIDYSWYDGDTIKNSIRLNSFDIILPMDFNPTKVGLVIYDILFAIR
jgi:hypothetical protein